MPQGWIHTVYRGGHWLNEIEGGELLSRHWTKTEAVEARREEARSRDAEHVIHQVDGTIAEHNIYGSDPQPPQG